MEAHHVGLLKETLVEVTNQSTVRILNLKLLISAGVSDVSSGGVCLL